MQIHVQTPAEGSANLLGYSWSLATSRLVQQLAARRFHVLLQCRRRAGGYSLSGCYDFLTVQTSVRVVQRARASSLALLQSFSFSCTGLRICLQFLEGLQGNTTILTTYYYCLLFSASRLLVQLTNADLEMLSTWLCFLTMSQSIVGISSFCQAAFWKGL